MGWLGMSSCYLLSTTELGKKFDILGSYDLYDVCNLFVDKIFDSNEYEEYSLCIWELIRDDEELFMLLGNILLPVKFL